MQKLNAILFDVDGTLADTEDLHRLAFNAAFKKYDLPWSWTKAQYSALLAVSGGPDRIRHYAQTLEGSDPRIDDPEFVRAVHGTKSELFRTALREGPIRLRPGIRRLMDEARGQGVKLGLATCTSMANVEVLLDQNLPGGWRDWFAAIITSNQVREMKPAPAVYLRALELMVADPSTCIAIEDTENGHRAALAAGLTTVVTHNEFTRHGDFSGAAIVVSNLGEPNQGMEVVAGPMPTQRYVDIHVLTSLLPSRGTVRPPRRPATAAALATGPAVRSTGSRSNLACVAHPYKQR